MLLPGLPMLWKKAVETICIPITGNINTTIRRPWADSAISSGASLANICTQDVAKKVPMRKPNVVMQVATRMVSLTTLSRRS